MVPNSGLCIGHVNIYHLFNKLHNVCLLLNQSPKFHVFGISETRLNHTKSDSSIHISNYTVLRRDAEEPGHTGIATYIHDSVVNLIQRRQDLEPKTLECMWLEAKLTKPVFICVLYRNPCFTNAWCDEFVEMMDKVNTNNKPIIILGDFNIDFLKSQIPWQSTINLFGLKQLIKQPTRTTPNSSTLIDHIYCNTPQNISNVQVIQSGMSDHCPVACTWLCKTPSKAKKEHNFIQYRSTKNFNSNAFLFDLSQVNFNDVYQYSNPENALEIWYQKFNFVLDKHAPLKTKRVKSQTLPRWLTPEIMSAMKERDACKKAGRHAEYKTLRNKISMLVKESKKKQFDDMVKNGNDTASLWRAINVTLNTSSNKAHIGQSSGRHTPQDFNTYFANEAENIFCKTYKDQHCDPYVLPNEVQSLCEENRKANSLIIPPIAVHEVGAYLTQLKNKRSMGPDNISTYFIKLSVPYIVESLTFIFNLCIAQSLFPTTLKEAKVIPIPKIKNPIELKNFRPISLLPILSKPLEKHIHKHIVNFMEENSLFYTFQSGFRRHHSCQTALTAMCDSWKEAINNKLITGAVFLDFQKAFDIINHNILLKKLDCYINNHHTTSIIKSYLEHRTQFVHLNGRWSVKKTIRNGIPQGSILGPLLFCIFINDLPFTIKDPSVACDMFADDNSLHSSGRSIVDVQNSLQNGLDDVQDWCKNNRMVLNPGKTKSMVITTRQKHQRQKLQLKLNIQSTDVQQVREHKVLGVIVDEELKWESHINYVNKLLSKNLFLLHQLKIYVDSETRKSFFYAHCLSHINYASNVWCGASANHIQHMRSLHRRAAKIIFPDPSLTTDEKQKQLGILPLEKQFTYNTAMLMFKVRNNKAPIYLNDLVTSASDRYGSENYILPLPRIDMYKTSFAFTGPSIWNSLPQHLTHCSTIGSFKARLRSFLLES
jgi:exonuclease III